MTIHQTAINNILYITGLIVFFYVLYQILIFVDAPTKYLYEYLVFFIALAVLYLFLPKTNISWK